MLDIIMKQAATNANRQFEALSSIATNIANINTTGYKNVRFEQYLTPDNRLDGLQRTDESQGSLMTTKRKMDVAVEGFGYIPVTQPDGTVAYTRDGAFTLNSQGYLVTQRGDMVGDGVQLPLNYTDMQIKPDGTISIQTSDNKEWKQIGKLSLSRFINPEGLKSIGYNKLIPTEASGTPTADTDSKLKQGMLEGANVQVHAQIDQILRLNASVISNMRIIKFADDLYRQSVNLKQ